MIRKAEPEGAAAGAAVAFGRAGMIRKAEGAAASGAAVAAGWAGMNRGAEGAAAGAAVAFGRAGMIRNAEGAAGAANGGASFMSWSSCSWCLRIAPRMLLLRIAPKN